jgi:tryptophan synthase alpha chain
MKHKQLAIYITAGYPNLNDTAKLIHALSDAGVDMIEIGMPYSDPVADGPVIQMSSKKSLDNGLTMDLLFTQIAESRLRTSVPLIYMGYLNQILQYGPEKFVDRCRELSIPGVIIPDLPMEVYESTYKSLFEANGVKISFLVTPLTSRERIIKADSLSTLFLYIVSQNTLTGSGMGNVESREAYFKRLQSYNLKSRKMIGFGIKNRDDVRLSSSYADGVIIGSAFISSLKSGWTDLEVKNLIDGLRT